MAAHPPERVALPPGPDVRQSAVLVPIYGDDRPWLILGKRSAHLHSHRGDLSFPGGRQHPEDSDLVDTALREADEEMGIERDRVDVVGELDHIGTMGTRFLIAPFVGVVDADPAALRPQEGEVDRILTVPIARLLEEGVYHQEIWTGSGRPVPARGPDDPGMRWPGPFGAERPVNFFAIDDWDLVWGATATILVQFLEVITRPD